jgi:hypothetical protein
MLWLPGTSAMYDIKLILLSNLSFNFVLRLRSPFNLMMGLHPGGQSARRLEDVRIEEYLRFLLRVG